jgi:2-C-methyl-D-erythritol 4-phosphate cytidylyltransferase
MNELKNYYAIIVAGGNGKRMETDIPKQFMMLNGLPILMHTLNVFHQNKYQPKIILVLAKADEKLWQKLVIEYSFTVPHEIVFGGEERFHSVKNALIQIKYVDAIIAIHDAVRPLVSQATISNCYQKANENGNAVAAIPSKDSVRKLSKNSSTALLRSEIYLVQTPQTFLYNQLSKAYEQDFSSEITDDASVVEKAGFPIYLEKGDEFNFKITFKEDLIIAESILNSRN